MTWVFALLLALSPSALAARVKDVASLYGVRDNALVGYGLVVGLNRSGDSAQNAAAIRALANRMQGLGMTMSDDDIRSRNVAMVMVTTYLPSGSRPGSRLDVQVSSTGDARSLEGGVLLLTPLYAANGLAVASAQGAVVVGGYTTTSGGDTTTKNHPTVARVPRGASVEIEVPNTLDIAGAQSFDWVLSTPDFTNAVSMVKAVNTALSGDYAQAVDNGTVRVRVPEGWKGRNTELLATLEVLPLTLDRVAKVVVNERTGTVVMGADISVSAVAIAHGSLTIEVDRQDAVSQPAPLSNGTTTAVANTTVTVDERAGRIEMIEGVTVGDVVSALNKMGVTPRDLIVILQAMQAAGGLQAQIETL